MKYKCVLGVVEAFRYGYDTFEDWAKQALKNEYLRIDDDHDGSIGPNIYITDKDYDVSYIVRPGDYLITDNKRIWSLNVESFGVVYNKDSND